MSKQTIPNYRVVGSQRMIGTNGVNLTGKDLQIFRPKIVESKNKPVIPPPTAIKQIAPKSADLQARQDAERRALDQRLAAERAALADRQRREAERLSKQMSPDQLKKWQARENDAYNDMVTRERNLLERYHDRETAGKVATAQPQARKFQLGTITPPPVTTQPAGKR